MKSFSLALLLVGTIVGAGFASGREILTFFGYGTPIIVAPLVGIGIFLVSMLFLFVGKAAKADNISGVNLQLLGKAHAPADIFLLANSMIVLAGMLACLDSLFSLLLPIAPAYSVIGGILCAFFVSRGKSGIKRVSSIAVPILILAVLAICCFSIKKPIFYGKSDAFLLPAVLTYVCMNMMLASTVFTTIKNLSARDIICASLIAALIIGGLMGFIITALNSYGEGYGDAAMPILQLAKENSRPLFYVGIVAVAASILTTIMTAISGLSDWLCGVIGDKKYAVYIVLPVGLIISNVGFSNVVRFVYPIIGVLGFVYVIVCCVFLVRRAFARPAKSTNRTPPRSALSKQGRVRLK